MLDNLSQRLARVVKTLRGEARLTEANTQDMLREIRIALLEADVALPVVRDLIARIREKALGQEVLASLTPGQALVGVVHRELTELMGGASAELDLATTPPAIILMAGLQGAGKTTTVGKLARRLQDEGRSVMLAAGDTFRAAAVEQLQTWGARNNVPVIAQQTGADSASVIFDAVQAAGARGADVLLADTAGRLHVKANLMEELRKIVRVMQKLDPAAPHEVLLVLDAGTGQNGLAQARHFGEAVAVTGIALTKLDGTAKGGIVFAVARELGLPIRFIGVGEAIEDLRPFDATEFVDALFDSGPG